MSRATLRDVRSVDGKPVNNRDKRILDLIRQASKTDSVEKELARINREGQRYDLDFSVTNTTALNSRRLPATNLCLDYLPSTCPIS